MAFVMKFDTRDLEKIKFLRERVSAKNFLSSFKVWLKKVVAEVQTERATGGTTETRLRRRTGQLARTLKGEAESKNDKIEGRITAGVRYAITHEFGREIVAKKKFLTIPLKAAQTPAGVTKKPAREWDNTFFRWVKGNLFLFQSRGKKIVPLFLLVKKVTIPPRLGVRETTQKNFPFLVSLIKAKAVQ